MVLKHSTDHSFFGFFDFYAIAVDTDFYGFFNNFDFCVERPSKAFRVDILERSDIGRDGSEANEVLECSPLSRIHL
jgi:hypothetical protein